MNIAGPVQFVVYLITGLVLGYLTFMSMMWGVWGAPVHPTHYIALLGALAVLTGAFMSLGAQGWGRRVSLLGLVALGSFWIPGVVSLVPQHNVIISPLAYGAFLLYFVALGFTLFYPKWWRWSVSSFIAVLCVAIGFVAVTTASRVRDGEFVRPSFAYFRWHPSEEPLIVERDSDGWIDSKTGLLLEQAGIHGTLVWAGSSGKRAASHRIIVLAQDQPSSRFELHYPRDRIIIYAYDGTRWRMIPESADTFSSFATLEPQNSSTILSQDVGGGRQDTTAFKW